MVKTTSSVPKVAPSRPEPPVPKGGTSNSTYLLVLGTLVLLVVTAVLVFRSSAPVGTDVLDLTQDQDLSEEQALLDPVPFRDEISALEAILYQDGPAGVASGDHVVFAARQLAEAVRGARPRPSDLRAAQQILDFAAEIDSSDVGFASLDLPSARARWEQLRGALFKSADWFSAVATQTRRPPVQAATGGNQSLEAALERVADSLAELIIAGRDESDWFGEIGVDVPEDSSDAEQLRSDWLAWTRGWEQRVAAATARLPRRPGAEARQNLVLAHQSLARALNDLRLIPTAASDTGVPSRSEREHRFGVAEEALEEARKHLAGIE